MRRVSIRPVALFTPCAAAFRLLEPSHLLPMRRFVRLRASGHHIFTASPVARRLTGPDAPFPGPGSLDIAEILVDFLGSNKND